ncbi:MAG: hypothetical protein FWG82_00230 [Oscillospiraceae bacterium]|nr:hypothetical protein [Oscillospiraceae bacterium]
MAQETHFRASLFGGFHKSDVLAYIENLQKQFLALQSEQQQRSRELPALREQIEAVTFELEQARSRENDFIEAQEETQRQLHALDSERDELHKKLLDANARLEQMKDVKGQVGTIIFDALQYSEKIIARAKETANIISRRAQDTVRESASDVADLGEDVTRISQDFGESLSQLVGRIKNVSADLSDMATLLEPDLTDGSEQYTFDAQGVPVLKDPPEAPTPAAPPEAPPAEQPEKAEKDWFADAPKGDPPETPIPTFEQSWNFDE